MTLKQFDCIICIGQTPWQGQFQNSAVQLMTELAQRHLIVYVDYQYTYKDLIMGFAGRRPVPIRTLLKRSDSLVKRKLENGSEIYIWTPPLMFPTNWMEEKSHDKVHHWNAERMIKGLLGVMKQLKVSKPLIVNAFNPVWGPSLLGRLNECGTLYYCYDEITAESWIKRHGERYEQTYLRGVDAVITTSEALFQSKSAIQPKAYCIKNGANFKLFNRTRQLAEAHPPEKTIVGYLGTADNRINIDLLEFCVKTMPEVIFQFIGQVNEPQLTQRLAVYANVVFTPSIPPAELPAMLAKLSAAMIPFVCNEHTFTIYPLKINEYLAAGLPVVSTPFSPLDEFSGIIELADSPEGFANALRRALADTSAKSIERRVEMARANSWEKRAEEFEQVVRQIPNAWLAVPEEENKRS